MLSRWAGRCMEHYGHRAPLWRRAAEKRVRRRDASSAVWQRGLRSQAAAPLHVRRSGVCCALMDWLAMVEGVVLSSHGPKHARLHSVPAGGAAGNRTREIWEAQIWKVACVAFCTAMSGLQASCYLVLWSEPVTGVPVVAEQVWAELRTYSAAAGVPRTGTGSQNCTFNFWYCVVCSRRAK